jgi:hypothetical protein
MASQPWEVPDELWELGVTRLIARRATAHGSGLGGWRWVVELPDLLPAAPTRIALGALRERAPAA